MNSDLWQCHARVVMGSGSANRDGVCAKTAIGKEPGGRSYERSTRGSCHVRSENLLGIKCFVIHYYLKDIDLAFAKGIVNLLDDPSNTC